MCCSRMPGRAILVATPLTIACTRTAALTSRSRFLIEIRSLGRGVGEYKETKPVQAPHQDGRTNCVVDIFLTTALLRVKECPVKQVKCMYKPSRGYLHQLFNSYLQRKRDALHASAVGMYHGVLAPSLHSHGTIHVSTTSGSLRIPENSAESPKRPPATACVRPTPQDLAGFDSPRRTLCR